MMELSIQINNYLTFNIIKVKKTLLISLVVATGITILTSCNQPSATQTTATVISDNSNNLKIAYINNDSLWVYYEYIDKVTKEFRSKQSKAQKRLQSTGLKLQGEVANFQKRFQAGLLSKNDAQQAEASLLKKQEQFEISRQSQTQGLLAEEQTINKNIYNRISSYLKEYNKEKGYNIVLGYAQGSNIWLADDALDITEDIIDGLNAKYMEEEAAEKPNSK